MKSPVNLPREMPLTDDEILAKYEDEDAGPLHIPVELIPPGMSYEWKMATTFGKEKDGYHAELIRLGWREVPMGRHRDRFGVKGMPDDAPIILNGLVLMEKPEALYNERQRYHEILARRQVKDKETQIGQRMPGSQLPRQINKMRKGYDRLEVE